jgi:diguanylate cyclase (GGDEF)-like protein
VKAVSVIAAIVGIALLPLSVGVAVRERSAQRADLQSTLTTTASDEAGRLEAYFARARSIILLTAHNPAFQDFYLAPGRRLAKVRNGGRLVRRAEDALAYLQRLYPNSIGEACFIDRSGAENARVVRGVRAGPADLSLNEDGHAFFQATFTMKPGQVFQASPYLSPDTHEWVISNSTLIPGFGARPPSIVHFEVTIDSFRRTAAAASHGHIVRVVNARTGDVILDSRVPQRVKAPLGGPGHGRFERLIASEAPVGTANVDGRPSAFRALRSSQGNANQWYVVVSSTSKLPSLLSSFGAQPIGMFLAAFVLLLFSLLGLTSSRNELRAAALTDSLTALGNRRKFVRDLERRIATTRGHGRLVLVLYDLDGFKSYNDTFGHPAGDALLSRLAHRLAAVMPSEGEAYRMGGDEFCVLASAPEGNVAAVAHAGGSALSERGEGFLVTASYGTVVLPADAQSASEALRLADQRMYARKQGSRPSADRQSTDVLVRMLYERIPALGTHVDDVADLADAVSAKMGLPAAERRAVRRAAQLHDVGKMAIPDAILVKPGPLDDEEWEFMRRHTVIGERILAAAPALAAVAELVRWSHERADGTGYPDNLTREQIPLGARIVAVCDAYDAMISERPYRTAMSSDDARAELRRGAGTQFDPLVVEAFCAVIAERVASTEEAA